MCYFWPAGHVLVSVRVHIWARGSSSSHANLEGNGQIGEDVEKCYERQHISKNALLFTEPNVTYPCYVLLSRGAWMSCCHPPLESTACPHFCCVYQHTLAKDTTSRPCLLKPCRDSPMGCMHGMRALGELKEGMKRERVTQTPYLSVCRTKCTRLQRGLPGRGSDRWVINISAVVVVVWIWIGDRNSPCWACAE